MKDLMKENQITNQLDRDKISCKKSNESNKNEINSTVHCKMIDYYTF